MVSILARFLWDLAIRKYSYVLLLKYNYVAIVRLHIHSNENKHKNNHGYGVKSAMLLYQFQCTYCDKYG